MGLYDVLIEKNADRNGIGNLKTEITPHFLG